MATLSCGHTDHRRRQRTAGSVLWRSGGRYPVPDLLSRRDARRLIRGAPFRLTRNSRFGFLEFLLDTEGLPVSCRMAGVEAGRLSVENTLLGQPSAEKAAEMIQMAMTKGSHFFEWTHRRLGGESFPAMVLLTRMTISGQALLQATVRDIIEHKQSEEKIKQMVYHDSLTGLPNRKLFSDRLGVALAQARRNQKEVGIAMLDLDHFKDVNDTLGHDVGDLLLKATAERLSAALRKGDTVARFGGDEFLLILPDLKVIEDAIQVAQKIVDSFHKPFFIDTYQLVVTTSIGIAVYPNDGTDEGILLKNADIAMYQAKQAGGGRYQLCKKA